MASDRVKSRMSKFVHRARFALDHRWAPGHMSAYIDGEIGSEGRGRMERHVGECRECRRLMAGLRVTVDALHRLPAPGGESHAVRIAESVRRRLR
jgi:anti-sigma factor RsiW